MDNLSSVQWVGWKNGERVSVYEYRWFAERALNRREVDAISPEVKK